MLIGTYAPLKTIIMNDTEIQSQLRALEFAVNSAFRKIFSMKSYDVVSDCVNFFKLFCFEIHIKIRERRTFSCF